ncbi:MULTISPECIES: hypothetical protein [Thalassospira]|nr:MULTISPECIES: hypothetical protein [Thalassospira]MDG4717716.1 hypothetical protein [Thalassospira sp. FZY0004]
MKSTVMNGFAVTALFLVSACGTVQTGSAPAAETSTPAQRIEARAVINHQCIQGTKSADSGESVPILGMLGAALIPKAIDSGVNALAAAVRKAGEETNEPIFNTVTTSYAYALADGSNDIVVSPDFGCLIVAMGNVVPGAASHDRAPWNGEAYKEKAAILEKLTGITGALAFYYEARIVPSTDNNSFHLLSKRLEYYGARDVWRSQRDLAMTVTFQRPGGTNGADQVFGVTNLIFKDVANGVSLDETAMAGHGSAWIPLPSIPAGLTSLVSSIQALETSKLAVDSQLQNLARNGADQYDQNVQDGKTLRTVTALADTKLVAAEDTLDRLQDDANASKKPAAVNRAKERLERENRRVSASYNLAEPAIQSFDDARKNLAEQGAKLAGNIRALRNNTNRGAITAKVELAETKDANKFLIAIADILDDAKPEISTALKTTIDPTTRENAKKAEEQAAETAAQNLYTQQLNVQKADQLVEKLDLELSLLSQTENPTNYLLKKHELDNAKLAANELRRRAGLAQTHIVGTP